MYYWVGFWSWKCLTQGGEKHDDKSAKHWNAVPDPVKNDLKTKIRFTSVWGYS